MLQDYRELAKSLKEKFQSITNWPEITFIDEDKRRLKELDGVTIVDKHSFQINIESNHCIIPGQYILYAICIKELAFAVKEHMDFFEKVKIGKSSNEIGTLLTERQFDFANISSDAYSKILGLKIFGDIDLNQGAKSIVNGTIGNYTIRGVSDFYTSIILKPINIPAASSAILGKFIYKLTQKPEVYSYLEKRFINQLPYITKEQTISKFVKNVITFLLQYDGLETIKSTYVRNVEPSLISIREGNLNLTSIFKISSDLLDESALSQGNRIRFFKEPVYFNSDNEFVYLSTEWTFGTNSRLDLSSFIDLIEQHYPEFEFVNENNIYFLKNVIGYRRNAVKKSLLNFNQLKINLRNSGFQVEDRLVTRFACSLLTKPFVILTGLSGSGKTKLAQSFAIWISENENQYCIVPVGADWTNREPLLGFPNALENGEYVKPDNGVLNLLIESATNPDKPYFLILDEMNLSHVERYFADFLSVMESHKQISLHAGTANWSNVPSKINLPSNLFIIGTVNIDETTYMFSSKVLDRASVIEFRVTEEEMKNYLSNNKVLNLESLEAAGAGIASDFVAIAKDKSLKVENGVEIDNTLISFFSELKKTGAEFGYRSASEILRFAAVVNKIDSSWSVTEIIDAAIMQKLLPKLHGSRNKLSKVLPVLGGFCLIDKSKVKEDYLDKFVSNSITEAELLTDTNIKYKISFEKICRMYKNAVENGFASYAEA